MAFQCLTLFAALVSGDANLDRAILSLYYSHKNIRIILDAYGHVFRDIQKQISPIVDLIVNELSADVPGISIFPTIKDFKRSPMRTRVPDPNSPVTNPQQDLEHLCPTECEPKDCDSSSPIPSNCYMPLSGNDHLDQLKGIQPLQNPHCLPWADPVIHTCPMGYSVCSAIRIPRRQVFYLQLDDTEKNQKTIQHLVSRKYSGNEFPSQSIETINPTVCVRMFFQPADGTCSIRNSDELFEKLALSNILSGQGGGDLMRPTVVLDAHNDRSRGLTVFHDVRFRYRISSKVCLLQYGIPTEIRNPDKPSPAGNSSMVLYGTHEAGLLHVVSTEEEAVYHETS